MAMIAFHLEAAPHDVNTIFLKLREVDPYAMSFSLESFLPQESRSFPQQKVKLSLARVTYVLTPLKKSTPSSDAKEVYLCPCCLAP